MLRVYQAGVSGHEKLLCWESCDFVVTGINRRTLTYARHMDNTSESEWTQQFTFVVTGRTPVCDSCIHVPAIHLHTARQAG